MQIVRDLAGYSYGGSDVLRRAMSKKKEHVMQEERRSFVYGDPSRNIPGCIAKGIDERVANHIYDRMLDFAHYAFNKSHAAAYAIVSFQTAWLKYYYPVEFMAALLTSVIDNTSKLTGYILSCRAMKIDLLPPDINHSESYFTVEDGKIRYALSAVKGIGVPVMEAVSAERKKHGPYLSMQDFCMRLTSRELNKRVLESLIKAGAFDSLGGTRKQYMQAYSMILDRAVQDKKNNLSGQLSLFDLMSPENKKQFQVQLPDVGEFSKQEKLFFEKDVIGIYISGHPLEDDIDLINQTVTAVSADFTAEDEGGQPAAADGSIVTIGGMITDVTVKYTKNNDVMAFFTLEDLMGSVEVIAFPKTYQRYAKALAEDEKVFAEGRVQSEENRPSKLILQNLWKFSEAKKEVWLQFRDRSDYEAKWPETARILDASHGGDPVMIYLAQEMQVRRLEPSSWIQADDGIVKKLVEKIGQSNVKVLQKGIEKKKRMTYN